MISGKKVLAVIPASSDSKGVKINYTRAVVGKSLIAWGVDAAEQSIHIDKLILSSDDLSIIQEAKNCGCDVPFLRPKNLSSDDNTSTLDLILHALEIVTGFDYVLILPPSAPLRTFEDIDNCLQLCVAQNAPAAVSVMEVTQYMNRTYTLSNDYHMKLMIKDMPPKVFMLTNVVAVADVAWLQQNRRFVLEKTVAYEMPRERSLEIQTDYDMLLAETSLRYRSQMEVAE